VFSYLVRALLDVIQSQQRICAAVHKPCQTGTDTPYYSDYHESDADRSTLPRLRANDASDEGEDRAFGETKS
jgi:hypothetical protein